MGTKDHAHKIKRTLYFAMQFQGEEYISIEQNVCNATSINPIIIFQLYQAFMKYTANTIVLWFAPLRNVAH